MHGAVRKSAAALLLGVLFACDSGSGPQSPQAPAAPKTLSPTDAAVAVAIKPKLAWTASDGATSYAVQVAMDTAFGSPVVDEAAVAKDSFAVPIFLANSTAYYWRVKAKNAEGASAWSAVASFTTDAERLVLLAPNGGQTYHAGDTIPVSFEYRNRPDTTYFVSLWFSPDGGRSFDMPVWGARNTVHWSGSPRIDTVWVIPKDTVEFGDYATAQAKIRVEDYTQKKTENDASDQPFTILGP
jgi:hypothetical protein